MFKTSEHHRSFLRYLANVWAVVLYIAVIFDFIKDNALEEFIGPLGALYVGVLALYASDKEFERWYHSKSGRHPGEIFSIVWSFVILVVLALDFLLQKPYKLPTEVISIYIAVLTILAITKQSKFFYEKKRMANY